MSELANRPQAVVESEEEGRSALAKLPAEWVAPVAYFCAAKLYLLKTRMPLVTNLNYWRASKGLTIEDLKPILRRLCDPEIACQHNFENQLMADLAALVNETLRRKRKLEEAARMRAAIPGTVEYQIVGLAELYEQNWK